MKKEPPRPYATWTAPASFTLHEGNFSSEGVILVTIKLRARAIEQLMCDFRIDDADLAIEFGTGADRIKPIHAAVSSTFGNLVELTTEGLFIRPEGQPLARVIAARYDAYSASGQGFSKAS